MGHIKITKGLDIPIKGKPQGSIQALVGSGQASSSQLQLTALDLKPFEDVKFKLLVKTGDVVKVGQPLAEDKSSPGRMFCSPGGGVIKEIRRGYRRVLQDIIIEIAKHEEHHQGNKLGSSALRDQIIDALKAGGAFAFIRSRPFNQLADPKKMPRSIFVKAIESAPFVPPAELQVEGYEEEFQIGLDALAKLTAGTVHLVYRKGTACKAFLEARNVSKHTAEGPHPIGTHSLHIQAFDPILSPEDTVWTLNAHDVVRIGLLLLRGRYHAERVISIAGPGVLPNSAGYFKVREGISVTNLISGRIQKGEPLRFISGDPLMGKKVGQDDFLGIYHYAFCVVPENTSREFLHFFGLGIDKYTFSKTYVSGHLNNTHREYDFTTNQHGEHRAFVDSTLYDKVMPLPISTMNLVKAVMAEDFELAEKYGLLTVDSEDFALPSFVCPSKMEMTEIIKQGLKQYAQDAG